MKKLALHWQILIAMILAVVFGLCFPKHTVYVSWMGEVFLRALKMIVAPLIATSIITGIIHIGAGSSLGRLGFKTILYYLVTSVSAILLGLVFVSLIRPGVGFDMAGQDLEINPDGVKTIGRTLIEIVPDNVFRALAENHLLAVILVAILTGIFTLKASRKTQLYFRNFFTASFEVVMLITSFLIRLAPLGIFGMVAQMIAGQSDVVDVFTKLGSFFITVSAALVLHGFVVIPLVMFLFWKVNPVKHLRNMSAALLAAFSTASSAVALPLVMEGVEKRSGVSSKITDFTLPIGATVNMDGTAIYVVSVVMFIAQAQGADLSLSQMALLVLTALLTSIGTAGIPMASLVIITIILDTLGLPYALIAFIIPVDRPLDMLRTVVNVWSDSCGAVLIAKSEGEQLQV